jgi:hypothetical protein
MGANITSPNARFVQWRAEMSGDGSESPSLTGISLSYLPQNTPPVVRSLNVTTQIAAAGTSKSATLPASPSTYSITVTDTGEVGASTVSGTPTQTVSRGVSQQIQISWQADDQDGDRIIYALYFRGESETQWKLLRGNLPETTLTLEGDVFADGKYLFRVVASDRPSNSASSARESDLTSAPILFDNTPPAVQASAPRRLNNHIEIEVEASDASSGLRRAEYSLDATAWVPVESVDGIVDGRQERFQLRLENVTPGEHLVVIRVFDSSNNAGLTKVVVP